MPNTNFPTGFAGGVTVRGMPLLSAYSGQVFWVDDAGGNVDGSFDSPFITVARALTFCVAGRGDIIVCKAGHAENISSNTALVMSVAGVAVLGLGVGTSRPTFTFDTANSATIAVSADNVSFINCVFVANFLSIAAAITLSTAKWFSLKDCLFYDTAAATDFLNCVKSTGGANTVDGLSVVDCQWFGTGVTSVNSMILVANANINVQLLRNRCVTERTADAPILITVTTGASKNIEIGENVVVSKQTASTLGVLAGLNASSTGVVYRNFAGTLVTASDILFTTTVGVFPFENRVSGVVGATGFVIPAVDT